jgi:hypothetical protein
MTVLRRGIDELGSVEGLGAWATHIAISILPGATGVIRHGHALGRRPAVASVIRLDEALGE